MALISNIATRTTEKHPQGAITGNLSVNDGVLSGFSKTAWIDLLAGRMDNATYVFKFTMPSSFQTSHAETIIHSQHWLAIELATTGELYAHSWEESAHKVILASPTAGTTYWLKIVCSGTSRTCYISTDGTNYTQAVSFSDNVCDATEDYLFRLGTSDISGYTGSYFRGTIDLNESYIEVGGEKVWKGMDYYDIESIGGYILNGQWLPVKAAVASSFTLNPDQSAIYSLANILPNDGHDYECQFKVLAITGTTSGNTVALWLYSGSTATSYASRVRFVRTRASNTQFNHGFVVLPIKASDKNIRAYSTTSSSGTSGTLGIWLDSIRRIGTNSDTGCEKINYNNTDYIAGGKQGDGAWHAANSQLIGESIASGTTKTLSLANILPADGYDYQCMFSVTALTGSTANNIVSAKIGLTSTADNMYEACSQVTRTASNMRAAGNCIFQVNSFRTIYVKNDGNAAGTITVVLRGYRRVGTNTTDDLGSRVTLTVNTTPADATVTFNTAGSVSGKTISVEPGTSVSYTVKRTGYTSKTQSTTVNVNTTVSVTLNSIYNVDQVLYESSTGGASSTLNLKVAGKYQVICVAGGGNGHARSVKISSSAFHTYYTASGGSGSGFNCVFQLSAGSYAISVGSGGANSATAKNDGGDSRFGTCYARGGKGSAIDGRTAGAGGASPTLTYTRTTTTLNTAGNAGSKKVSSEAVTVNGGAAVYSSYGKGANARFSTTMAGTAGYVKVVYKGQ